jgi:hypothetical protein
VIGYNLEGKRFELPHDFKQAHTLVLIAFEQWQQEVVNTWLTPLAELVKDYPMLDYYELPTINTMSPLYQAYIDGVMYVGIPDRRARERTITLYVDVKTFCQALQLPTTENIYVLLLDQQGDVRWQVEGEYTPAKGTDLRRMLTV